MAVITDDLQFSPAPKLPRKFATFWRHWYLMPGADPPCHFNPAE